MVDTSSVEALIETFPKVPRELTGPLMMDSIAPKAIPKAVAKLARRGFLGFVPVGEVRGVYVALRLLPGVPLEGSACAELSGDATEGLTFAPRLSRFVAGRLAHLDVASPEHGYDAQRLSAIPQLAADLGDEECAKRVVEAIPKLREVPTIWDLIAATFQTADGADPLFEALSAAWRMKGPDVARWADERVKKPGAVQIVHSLRVGAHARFKLPGDITDSAWAVVMGDAVLDAHYDGFTFGPGSGWVRSPLHFAAQALEGAATADLDADRAAVFDAAKAFAKSPDRYAGEAHLAAARSLRKGAPHLAWTHACNAAAFRVRSKRRIPRDEIAFAAELADEQGFRDLAVLCRWAARAG